MVVRGKKSASTAPPEEPPKEPEWRNSNAQVLLRQPSFGIWTSAECPWNHVACWHMEVLL
jgi:hypothetical protein